jgi:hypothetical protein
MATGPYTTNQAPPRVGNDEAEKARMLQKEEDARRRSLPVYAVPHEGAMSSVGEGAVHRVRWIAGVANNLNRELDDLCILFAGGSPSAQDVVPSSAPDEVVQSIPYQLDLIVTRLQGLTGQVEQLKRHLLGSPN